MRKLFFMTAAVLLLLSGTACDDIKDKKTTIQITDNNRHYYPILMGQELNIVFPVKNTGKNPFILEDIITSCGCISLDKSSIGTIPPSKEAKLVLTYNSAKNIGEVQHYITLYGNFATTQKMELMFDVHVVPQSLYTKDYEEMFQEEKNRTGNIEDLADGNENNKGYYLD
ncbi:MAG: DUF1573 domain-containing protein [Chryseobacterium sp.]|nr:DUF1573 domain-containing protein [Chryseobacterium sp.]